MDQSGAEGIRDLSSRGTIELPNSTYAVQLADEVWVVHAFQKKSKQGIKTPKHEIDLVKDRLKRLKKALR
jgi:phage-related protein